MDYLSENRPIKSVNIGKSLINHGLSAPIISLAYFYSDEEESKVWQKEIDGNWVEKLRVIGNVNGYSLLLIMLEGRAVDGATRLAPFFMASKILQKTDKKSLPVRKVFVWIFCRQTPLTISYLVFC